MSLGSAPDQPIAAVQAEEEYQSNTVIAALGQALDFVNRMVIVVCMLAMLLAACILTYSVVARYFLKISTDWQDEAAVFLLVGSVFLASAYVQSYRGHIGIDALATLLPAKANRARLLLIDMASLVFCTFFAWKSWTLLAEAVHDGYTTGSEWGPPLWIPYSTMALGMSLLCVQILLQFLDRVLARGKPR